LHGLVDDEEMLAATTEDSPREACRKLVDLAKQRGGHDNITIQVIRIERASATVKEDSTAVGS
jgi:protein phosphatase